MDGLVLSQPGSEQAGISLDDVPPSASTAWWKSQSLVVTSNDAQDIDGVKNFLQQPTQNGNPTSWGYTLGPIVLTGYVHNSGRKYFALSGGASLAQADAQNQSPAACPKVRGITLVYRNNSTLARTVVPSANTLTMGFAVNSIDQSTAQTIPASADSVITTPTWTTGWAKDDSVAVWIQGTGSSSATVSLTVWMACY